MTNVIVNVIFLFKTYKLACTDSQIKLNKSYRKFLLFGVLVYPIAKLCNMFFFFAELDYVSAWNVSKSDLMMCFHKIIIIISSCTAKRGNLSCCYYMPIVCVTSIIISTTRHHMLA